MSEVRLEKNEFKKEVESDAQIVVVERKGVGSDASDKGFLLDEGDRHVGPD